MSLDGVTTTGEPKVGVKVTEEVLSKKLEYVVEPGPPNAKAPETPPPSVSSIVIDTNT